MNAMENPGTALTAQEFFEVYGFLCQESDYLSRSCHEAWLKLLDPTIRYRVVTPSFLEATRPRTYGLGKFYFDDDYATLQIRVKQLTTPNYSIAESPVSVLRHFVTNISGRAIDGGFEVKSNVLVYRIRATEPEPAIIAGQRVDTLMRTSNGLRLVRREAQLDQVSLQQPNLSFFL